MNRIQLQLRTAAHARDYDAIEQCYAFGATAADALNAVLPDITHGNDVVLYDILLCSAPDGIDIEPAIEIAKTLRREHPVAAMYIRWAFLKKLALDGRLPKQLAAGQDDHKQTAKVIAFPTAPAAARA